MRVIVVGLGVQGQKRRKFGGADYVTAVDPVNREAEYRQVDEVPLDRFDAALVCVPDEPKVEVLRYLLGRGKHVLVEKPLWAADDANLLALEKLARETGATCYTAYNHRFEPHYVRMRDLVRSGALGRIYRCRMFYGNGTARLVRETPSGRQVCRIGGGPDQQRRRKLAAARHASAVVSVTPSNCLANRDGSRVRSPPS